MPRKVILKQVGYLIEGEAMVNLWGGGSGTIPMDRSRIPLGKMCKDNLLRCVNDGQFGCESFQWADVMIYDLFEDGYKKYNRTIHVKARPARQGLFCSGI